MQKIRNIRQTLLHLSLSQTSLVPLRPLETATAGVCTRLSLSTSSNSADNYDFIKAYQKKLRNTKSKYLEQEQVALEQQQKEEKKSLVKEFYKYPVFIQQRQGICVGCGTQLQTENRDAIGYVQPYKLEKNQNVICERCRVMSHHTTVDDNLRIGASEEQTNKDIQKTLKLFEERLESICSKRCIIVYMVDIFDFDGSFISKLPSIVQKILLYVWVKKQCAARGLTKIHRIHLISCTKDYHVSNAKADIIKLVSVMNADVYVVGCTNVGKSSFINRFLTKTWEKKTGKQLLDDLGLKEGECTVRELKQAIRDKKEPELTTSAFPGTTLNTIRIHFGRGHNMFDTPGIVQPQQITHLLNSEEVNMLLPKKRVRVVTFRLHEGKCIHLGGIARIEMLEGKPFFFTIFASNEIKVHPSDSKKAEELLETHAGGMLKPPSSWRRLKELGAWKAKEFELEGVGWLQSSHDIVITGLGWVSVTGCGKLRVRCVAPQGVGVYLREPMAPFEVLKGVSRYTGSKAYSGNTETRS
eukprot:jgi/Galph1/2241/GphlegSOOS_G872.1